MSVLDAVILAGGRGERLGDLTKNTPKPLLIAAGEPFISHLLVRLGRAGLKRVGVLTGPFEETFSASLGNGSRYGVTLALISEPEPAGTGGALRYVRTMVGESFICMNGDSLFDIDFDALAKKPLAPGADIDLCLRRVDDTQRFGRVELDNHGNVTHFGEKEARGPGLINAGIYRIRSAVIERLEPRPSSLETEIIPALVARKRATGWIQDAPFLDIGIPADFSRATDFIRTLPT